MNNKDQIIQELGDFDYSDLHIEGTNDFQQSEITIITPTFRIEAKVDLHFDYDSGDSEVGLPPSFDFVKCSECTITEIYVSDGIIFLGKGHLREVEREIRRNFTI